MNLNIKLPEKFIEWCVKFEESRLNPDIKLFHERLFTEVIKQLLSNHPGKSYEEVVKLLNEGGWSVLLPFSQLFPGMNPKYVEFLFYPA